MKNQMPHCFRKVKYSTFKEDKIIVDECYSTLAKYSQIISIYFALGLLLFCYFISYIIKYYTKEDFGHYVIPAFIILFLIISLFLDKLLQHHVVIDLRDNCIYSELILLGFYIKSKKIFKDEISQIANNIYTRYPEKGETYGEIHPETKYVYLYSLDFLLKNGKVVDMLIMGKSESDYDRTIELAFAISELWGIPAITCKENYQLSVVDTLTNSENRYKFSLKEIEPRTFLKDFLRLIKIFIILIITLLIIAIGANYITSFISSLKPTRF